MSTSTHKGRRFGVLVAFSLVAGLMVAPLPASAATGDVESEPVYSACVDGATASAAFTDVAAGAFYEAAVNCMKYYGVTAGTTATTYGPTESIPRWQMAIFLARVADRAGVTMPSGATGPFTDIADETAVAQTAINQIAALSITSGTSATTFDPEGVVSRWQMAIFVETLLSKVKVGPGGSGTGGFVNGSGTSASGFTDLGSVTARALSAIEEIFDLAVTAGKGTGATFAPYDNVTRGEMAVFLAAAMKHTNIRPAGVSIQSDISSGFGILNPILSISVRDAAFKPVVNALVDIFRFQGSTTVTSAFATDGTCVTTGEVTKVSSGPTVCKIDLTDNATDSNGNIPSWGWSVTAGKTGTFYAWTGTSGATFDNDTTASANVSVVSSPEALSTVASWNLPANASIDTSHSVAKFGTVTYTFQLNSLADGTGDPVAQAGQTITYNYMLTTASGAVTGTGLTLTTDANGTATVSFTATDPNVALGDDATLDFSFVSGPGAELIDMTDEDVVFMDGTAVGTLTKLAATNSYVVASATGAVNTVSATTYDQYGNGMANQTVGFTSDDTAAGIGSTTVNRITNSSGVAALSWSRNSAASGAEYVTAAGATSPATTVYWVVKAGVGTYGSFDETLVLGTGQNDGTFLGQLLADVANDGIVAVYDAASSGIAVTGTDGVYYLFTYDSNDQFNSPSGTPVTMAAFEAAIDPGTQEVVSVNYAATAGGVSIWTTN